MLRSSPSKAEEFRSKQLFINSKQFRQLLLEEASTNSATSASASPLPRTFAAAEASGIKRTYLVAVEPVPKEVNEICHDFGRGGESQVEMKFRKPSILVVN